jgi:hypothetical protein
MPKSVQERPKVQLLSPLPWNERDSVLGYIKCETSYMLENLANLLQLVSNGTREDEVIAWPDPRSEITLGNAIKPIIHSGLLSREASGVHLSTHGKSWLNNKDPEQLVSVLHAHVRFIGEILRELEQESMSSPALLKIAREKYGFGWTTGGAISMRIKWLVATGLVNSYSHKYHLSDRGKDLLAGLTVYEPEVGVTTPADLQPAPLAIEDLIRKLEENPKRRSRAAGFYIPGIKTNNGQIDTLRTLVETCAAPIRDQVLWAKSANIFNTETGTADAGIRSLIASGLLERVSSTEIAATPAGLAWVASPYPIDLARIVHANVWYFGEIIHELDTSKRLTFTEILQRCAKYSMASSYEPLKRGALTARIALLRALGLISKGSNNSYMATPLGIAFYDSMPHIDSIDRVSADHSPCEVPDSVDTEHDDPAYQIADNLIRAARMSDESVELEIATIEALNFLGLPATHLGGHGPDGIVHTRPGKLGSVLTVETKSSANGTVPEERAKPATLADHREQHGAEATVYVGPGFERRLLDILDNDERVAVISASVLAEAVRRQVNTPLTPEELDPLVDPSIHEKERRSQLLVKWKEKEDWTLFMRGIAEILSREADAPMSDEELDSLGVGWLDTTTIRRSLRDLLNREVSKELIREVLIFLASPQLAIVEQAIIENNHDVYRLRVSLEAIPRHFMYVGRRWLFGDRLFHH